MILFFTFVILLTLVFIIYVFKNLPKDFWERVKIKWKYYDEPHYVEKTYNLVTLQHSFSYLTEDILNKQRLYGLFPQDISSSNIVTSDKHLEAIFEKEVRVLTREMIKQRLVEITQFENRDYPNSPITVVVKVRAYKEE